MKKTMFALPMIVLIAYFVLPLPFPGQGAKGMYNSISHLSWCTTPVTCAHEAGHRLDQTLEWPSNSKDFAFAVQTYVVVYARLGDVDKAGMILRFPGMMGNPRTIFFEPMPELYATIFAEAGGNLENIPEEFRKFYAPGWNK